MVAFTSKDVARLAGVSQSTVSYVLTGKRPISAGTRQRVLAAIEELTYQPHQGARALASQRTSVVGLVVPFSPGADTGGLLPFIETIASSARERDHEVLLVTADEGSAGLLRLAGRSLCDGIVLMDIQRRGDARIPVAAALPVPVVLVGVPDDALGLHCVDLDFPQAVQRAGDLGVRLDDGPVQLGRELLAVEPVEHLRRPWYQFTRRQVDDVQLLLDPEGEAGVRGVAAFGHGE